MQRQTNNLLIFILMSLMLISSISCQWLSIRSEEIIRGESGYYLINPDTILDELAQGNIDVFALNDVTPEPPLLNPFSAVQWTESDYFLIAQALYQFVWNESIEDWSLWDLTFAMRCGDVSNGPQTAYFTFYKVVQVREQESRLKRQLNIDPSNNSVSWSEIEYYPNLVHLRPLDLSQHKLSVTEVLQIAERNGGGEARAAVDNNCIVRIQLFNSNIWRVSYVQVLDLLSMDIDARSGKYKIIATGTN